MKEFRTFDNTIKVSLGPVTFEGDPAKFEMACGNASKIVDDLNNKINSGLATDEIIGEAIGEMAELFEGLFGKGSTKKVLNKNEVSFHDMCDIFVYCKKAAHEFEVRKAAFYNQSYNTNYNRNRKR